MARCGACSQRAGSATNSPHAPLVLGIDDGRLRRVRLLTALAGVPSGTVVYATGADVDALLADRSLQLV